jgi:bifunctional DNA-binding transcriptional regulator/antitoxin component of YhaV-PrlF toxin-antitoxin module
MIDNTVDIPTKPLVRTVRKLANSLYVTIPKGAVELLGIDVGDEVAVIIYPLRTCDNG